MDLSKEKIVDLLSLPSGAASEELFSRADEVRRKNMGEGVITRGIVEFSSICDNTCAYCGLRKGNGLLQRYSLSCEEILGASLEIHLLGIKTVILQSGEDKKLDAEWFTYVIKAIKKKYDMAVTLSVGEKTRKEYEMWKKAGADRYLLKIETTDRGLYVKMHPGMDLDKRIECLDVLAELGYQVGSGNIIGLKGQSLGSIADDILFFKSRGFDMLGIGPFLPHGDTPLGGENAGDIALTLKALAVTRIVIGKTHLPATTALGFTKSESRIKGLNAGANVIMLNFTPERVRGLYDIYPGKNMKLLSPAEVIKKIEEAVAGTGRFIDYSRGDSFRGKGQGVRVTERGGLNV
ncbi:MAG: [FeFe] hydrogenase H-cluster radical SAM maturase HydE [Candidatus Omnitrophica bacterium]|nr:[FeFe] hydrogenase H-cluster radical SAM maturase HydE [Candidatus Omnitrophota bacterium]